MLPAHALRPLIRYFDAVDRVASAGMLSARPHLEVTMTSVLCDLMDEREQTRYRLARDVKWLRQQLGRRIAASDISFEIATHEYPPKFENWVSQSDIGLIIEFADNIVTNRDWVAVALLQAKRLVRSSGSNYGTTSTYGANDRDQRARIEVLNELFGFGLVRNLLYTPRPADLADPARSELRHRRDLNLSGPIYDYDRGLVVHRELTRKKRVVDGGIIVSPNKPRPTRLDRTYDDLFLRSVPWSWFLALTMIGWPAPSHSDDFADVIPQRLTRESLSRMAYSPVDFASGKLDIAARVVDALGSRDLPAMPMLPSRTIRVRVTTGDDDNTFDQ